MPKPASSVEIGIPSPAPGDTITGRTDTPAPDPRATATDRSLAIIDLVLSAPAPMSARMIGSGLDLPKATVHRLIGALEDKGLIAREPVSGGYAAGPALCEMAFKILSRSAASADRHAVLAGLAAATAETCNLGILDGSEARYIDRVEASVSPLRLDFRPGSRVPLYASAMGKLFLAQMPPAAFERYLSAAPRIAHTPATRVEEAALREAIAACREAGHGDDDEEYILGVNCLSVPIPLKRARHLAALAVQAPKSRKDLTALRAFLPAMRAAAEQLAAIFDTETEGRR
jgi:IclR family transcriptional regulator, acetate operon repressor